MLRARVPPPSDGVMQALIATADRRCGSYSDALAAQEELNNLLAPFSVFVYSSDLEGFLADALGLDFIGERLGPTGERVLTQDFIDELQAGREAWLRDAVIAEAPVAVQPV